MPGTPSPIPDRAPGEVGARTATPRTGGRDRIHVRTQPGRPRCAGHPGLSGFGRAELVELPASPPPVDHFTKHAAAMAAVGLGRDEYVRTYSLAIRVTPTRFLPWGGRSHLDERRADAGGPDATRAPASTI